MTGFFLTLEGVDGAGKSSHTEWLVDFFKQKNYKVVLTREPGGTVLGEKLRELLLSQQMTQTSEVLLMFAAREESVNQVIKPALNEGKVIISDRFTDSTLAYQGGGRHYPIERIQQLAEWVHGDTQPNLTLLFDVPLEVAKQRMSNTRVLDRFEKESELFFTNVRQMYLRLAEQYPQRFVVVDSTQSIEKIKLFLTSILEERLA
ncbi:thymidylate kinase [Pelistega indica]|uniref:Thymidylate kinase n=1 Tax=Pelistega indica TaxID=1414851 RepID=V8G6V3_9BURK|nr:MULTISPECIES: dTMP kinase [Pelistega]ETD71708.1 thymidylate kinase [Pelistega indica]